jgi:hypothetical protein
MQTFVNVPPYLLGYGAAFPKISTTMLAAEPSLFSCSEEGAAIQGGLLAKIALKHIQGAFVQEIYRAKQHGLSAIVDVRVQNLMPGMYPAPPGWHCDGVPRCNYHGQPQFCAVSPASFNVCVSLSSEQAGVSNTEYVLDPIKLKLFDSEHVYREIHEVVEKLSPRVQQINDGIFVKYTPKTIHRAAETHRRGLRMFMRFSMYHKPPIVNGVSSQQQVYLLSEKAGCV